MSLLLCISLRLVLCPFRFVAFRVSLSRLALCFSSIVLCSSSLILPYSRIPLQDTSFTFTITIALAKIQTLTFSLFWKFMIGNLFFFSLSNVDVILFHIFHNQYSICNANYFYLHFKQTYCRSILYP